MCKKVLFISSRPIYPITGGDQIRTAQQLKFLLEKYTVDVFYLSGNKNDDELLRNSHPEINQIFSLYSSKARHYLQTLRFIFNQLPLQVNYYYDLRMKKMIDSNIDKYDIVFCNNIRTAQYVINNKITKYLDFVDAISMNYQVAKENSVGFKRLVYTIDFERCRKYEQDCLKKFDRCAIISEVDKEYILDFK